MDLQNHFFFAFFGFCNVLQKLMPQAQKYTFSSSVFCSRSISCKTLIHLKKIAPVLEKSFVKRKWDDRCLRDNFAHFQ